MMPVIAIRPESVASKLAAADSLQSPRLAEQLKANPRLVELLWFIQWHSFQPGGVAKLADDFLAAFGNRVSTEAMRQAGPPGKDGKWSLQQCLTAWRAEYCEPLSLADLSGDSTGCESLSFACDDFSRWARGLRAGDTQFRGLTAGQSSEGLRRFNHGYFATAVREQAAQELPALLKAFCETEGPVLLPTWFPSLLESLSEFMDQHAARERARLVMTAIAAKVFDAFDYAIGERKLVHINGSSRFGKTESVNAYCAMYPGRLRLVTVPCSNSERDLVRAVAEALGISASYCADATALRGKVEYVLRHGRLGFAMDESHFLFPIRYNRDTVPLRLNWLRTQIVDRHLPCVLVSTPQAYEGQRKRFDRATGYNMEQFTGRIAMSVNLPEWLSVEDMTAVARLHFPELRESLVGMAVGAAKQSHGYLQAFEDIASRARRLAGKRGASGIALRDIEAAIKDVVPEVASQPADDSLPDSETGLCEPAAETLQPRRKTSADVLQEVCGNRISGPELTRRGRVGSTERMAETVPA